MKKNEIKRGSILFAPMEGVTDQAYRIAINNAFPQWDGFSTDFLRIPSTAPYPTSKILSHFGEQIYKNKTLKEKTSYQILASPKSLIRETLNQLKELGFSHIDLNLGCPSRRVNQHQGGAFLLQDLNLLENVIKTIRENFHDFFSAKIRVGYSDDSLFIDILKLLEHQGVDAITIHARTRNQLYKGIANWSYIKKATKTVKTPIIGNGDIWTHQDIDCMFEQTHCHAIMLARGALKTPWITKILNKKYDPESLLEIRCQYLPIYFENIKTQYQKFDYPQMAILKRFKAISRYLFDDFEDAIGIKKNFMRSKSIEEFEEHLYSLRPIPAKNPSTDLITQAT